MIASSATMWSNLAYLLGAVVLAVIGGMAVWLRHRKPKSVDATMESFRRGLDFLAPQSGPQRTRGPGSDRQAAIRPQSGGLSQASVSQPTSTTVRTLPGGFPSVNGDSSVPPTYPGDLPSDVGRKAGDQTG
jgi:hypothetical protein